MNPNIVNGLIIFFILILAFVLSTIVGVMVIFLINETIQLIFGKKIPMIPYWIALLMGSMVSIVWIMFVYDYLRSTI